jgi:hypothetical protein
MKQQQKSCFHDGCITQYDNNKSNAHINSDPNGSAHVTNFCSAARSVKNMCSANYQFLIDTLLNKLI